MICKQSDGNAVDSAIPELAKLRVLRPRTQIVVKNPFRFTSHYSSRSMRRDGVC